MHNLIPLLFDQLKDVQAAVDTATREVEAAVGDFGVAATALLQKYADHGSKDDLERMIVGCQYACTANVAWR